MDSSPSRRPFFSRPAVWALFGLAALAAIVYTVRGFGAAFPLVAVDLRIDRAGVLDAAGALAERYGWEPRNERRAAAFRLDDELQAFVELEAGGVAAFRELIEGDLLAPYTWQVRLFREGEPRETRVSFTPAGAPWGFRETLPETAPGAALPREEALAIARATASTWEVDLPRWRLVESSSETRVSGRVDHTFVFERAGVRLGEAEVRMRIAVAGDRPVELTRFLRIPESFTRQYEEMRSANDAIAAGAGFATVVLYLIGGCGVGLFLLGRGRHVLWRPAIAWAAVIAGLGALARINEWPLLWMGYDTALSAESFAVRQAFAIAGELAVMGVLLAASFAAAEGLTRLAFPREIRLWRLWSPGVAATPAVLGRTTAGYLLVPLFFAYEVLLYFVAQRSFGWWTPSGVLFDPDILATWLPWLGPVATALQAGFWEECLFRAVPLAGAALLGRRFGRPAWWIGATLLLQAVIFGAGHANYANQPAWARPLELILPALLFGAVYLAFGLLPAIVLHVVYDLVWMGLPLFVSQASGAVVSQLFVVALGAVPLAVVLARRLAARRWGEIGPESRNASWVPPPPTDRRLPPAAPAARRPRWLVPAAVVLGVAGLASWIALVRFTPLADPVAIERPEAIVAARAALAERGIRPPAGFLALASFEGAPGQEDVFVWRTSREAYEGLLGSWLYPPMWRVRFARFEGDLAERAEEWIVLVGPRGDVLRIRHRLPEARPGPALEESAARELALAAVRREYGLQAEALEDVAVAPSRRPGRTDWRFTFRPAAPLALAEGEGRVEVEVAGEGIADIQRYVQVPEAWERVERDRSTLADVLSAAAWGVAALIVLGALAAAFLMGRDQEVPKRSLVVLFAVLLALQTVELVNAWPALLARLSTAQPLALQVGLALAFGALVLVLTAAGFALVGSLGQRAAPPAAGRSAGVLAGLGTAGLLAGLLAASRVLLPATEPWWGDYSPLDARLPWLAGATGAWIAALRTTGILLLVLGTAHRVAEGRRRRTAVVGILALLGAAAAAPAATAAGGAVVAGALGAAVAVVVFLKLYRSTPAAIPWVVAGLFGLGALRTAILGLYPGAAVAAALGAAGLAAIAAVWSTALVGPPAADPAAAPAPATPDQPD